MEIPAMKQMQTVHAGQSGSGPTQNFQNTKNTLLVHFSLKVKHRQYKDSKRHIENSLLSFLSESRLGTERNGEYREESARLRVARGEVHGG